MKLNPGNPLTATLLGLIHRLRREDGIEPLPPGERLDGLRCLITGGSSGLGLAVAHDLARRGAGLILPCRSGIPEVGEAIRRRSANGAVQQLSVDLADLDTVDALCDQLVADGVALDVVICNAAVMPRASRSTAQGFELMFGVNYLSHALLLRRLLADGVIATSSPAGAAQGERHPRIVVVTSEVHRHATALDLDALGAYVHYGALDGLKQYAHSKLLLATFAQELARRLQHDGQVEVAVHSLCPGAVDTNLAREAPLWLRPVLQPVMRFAFAAPALAARPVVYLAAAAELEGQTAHYLHTLTPKEVSPAARDRRTGARLWERTHKLLRRRAPGP